MSTIKISELPKFTTINANTSNTLFVGIDIPSAQTFQFSAGTLAEGLFSNTALIVGNNRIVYPSTTAQFSGVANNFLQINLQNFANGIYSSSDFVASTVDSDNASRFIDMGIDGPLYNDPVNYSAFKPYDGYLYVHGPGDISSQGNLILGTASSDAIVKFIVGGTMSENIVAWMTKTGLNLNTQSYITFSDGTTQTTAAASNAYSQAAFSLANTTVTNQAAINTTQNTSITAAFTQANTAGNTATSAGSYANSAFAKANNALANTTGTFAGSLTLTGNLIATGIQSTTGAISTGNLIVNGYTTSNGIANIIGTLNVSGMVNMNAQVILTNTSFSNTESALTIAASPTVATPSNDGYMIHISGKNDVPSRIVTDSYGTGAYSVFAGRAARGNVANPTAVQAGDIMSRFSGNGYGTTKYQSLGVGRIDFIAAENFTDANTGSQIKFWNCPVGTNTLTNIATFNGDSAVFTGVVNPQKGFVYTPRIPVGNQTTIAIDYASDAMIKANLVADLTVTHSNFITGKVVEVWLINSGGTNRTVTHGISALNSTTNSTTFTIPSTSAAYLRYFSIDGDIANTFVSVVHA
jgi:hypothetical protein